MMVEITDRECRMLRAIWRSASEGGAPHAASILAEYGGSSLTNIYDGLTRLVGKGLVKRFKDGSGHRLHTAYRITRSGYEAECNGKRWYV